jgi:hypothetical protein
MRAPRRATTRQRPAPAQRARLRTSQTDSQTGPRPTLPVPPICHANRTGWQTTDDAIHHWSSQDGHNIHTRLHTRGPYSAPMKCTTQHAAPAHTPFLLTRGGGALIRHQPAKHRGAFLADRWQGEHPNTFRPLPCPRATWSAPCTMGGRCLGRARQIDPHARRGYGASRVQLQLQLLVAAVLPEADLEAARNVHAGAQLGLGRPSLAADQARRLQERGVPFRGSCLVRCGVAMQR